MRTGTGSTGKDVRWEDHSPRGAGGEDSPSGAEGGGGRWNACAAGGKFYESPGCDRCSC